MQTGLLLHKAGILRLLTAAPCSHLSVNVASGDVLETVTSFFTPHNVASAYLKKYRYLNVDLKAKQDGPKAMTCLPWIY